MNIFTPANILLPKITEFEKWSVIACDQYSSEPKYWERAAGIAGDAPSTLRLVFPEAYLDKGGDAERIGEINAEMEKYLRDGIFEEYPDSFIYVERGQSNGRIRRGIVGQIDLEQYDFSADSRSAVRATEGTILSRIPPRQRIRRNAPLELPHILLLIDDREKTVIEPIAKEAKRLRTLYDFDLMLGGGHIRGRLLDEELKRAVSDALRALAEPKELEKKYGTADAFVIAAGDGNHSLATAKSCWEELKTTLSQEERRTHPARFALAELVNLHDESLEFEPIHRVLFDVDPDDVERALKEYYPQLSPADNGGQPIIITRAKSARPVYISDPPSNLAVGTLQLFLDEYLERRGGRIDYIHGDETAWALCEQPNTIGFVLGAMDKNDLFKTVTEDGSLPRKTFSMGEAADKRYYLEAKRIR